MMNFQINMVDMGESLEEVTVNSKFIELVGLDSRLRSDAHGFALFDVFWTNGEIPVFAKLLNIDPQFQGPACSDSVFTEKNLYLVDALGKRIPGRFMEFREKYILNKVQYRKCYLVHMSNQTQMH